MIYTSIAISRRYASILLVGTCFIFSSIKVRSSSVTRNLIYIFLFLFSIGKLPFRFHRGFGIPPKGLPQQALACEGTSKISVAGTAENRDFFYGKGTPFLCLLFHLSLNLYNNGNSLFAKDCKEKRCNLYNSNVYFVRSVQLVFDTLDVCFFVFLSLLFRRYLPIIIGYSYHKIT